MASKFRTFAKKFLIALNIVLAFVYLLACLAPFLDPHKWWFISLLGLFFPFLFVILFGSILFWLFTKRKYAFLFLALLLLGWNSIRVSFGFHKTYEFNYEKQPQTLRIVSWNVARFIEIKKNNNKGSQIRLKMMDLLKQQNADVLCLQEFHTSSEREGYYDNISYIQKHLNYPYYYFSFDEDGSKLYYSSIIFSRLPIIDSGRLVYPKPALPEALLAMDVKLNNDTIRIFTTHLQSVQFRKKDYERIDEIKTYQDSLIENSRNIFSKIKKGITYRSIQANVVKKIIKLSPHPVVLCGDFNDVPNSYTYFTIRGNMQDVFLKKGFGVGRSFTSLSPTLRIDYILASKQFSILQFNKVTKKYSDHYMLVADLKIPTP
ncbi:MAG TPA: endonuclease/exonuclease/phosphatase family protein [Chitinophagaceae bacterium]|jgi:endonuclease/exonuclease/phosphatase family metal-dependent hydrolase|nr:endonuclease/exonuclease/phosphatase family protein [Chitinophagaceae bacterium]